MSHEVWFGEQPLRSTAALGCVLLGCATGAASPESVAPGPVSQVPTVVGTRELASASPSAAANSAAPAKPSVPPVPAPCSRDTPPDALAGAKFTHVHAGPVLSIAVGTPPRVGVWSGQSVTVIEGGVVRELPAPRLPPGATVELYFGRDNQPRLMGFAPGELGREVPVYLRFRHGVFRPEPAELGPLGAPKGALYGVLGFEDPEVVCRPQEFCLVKRTTGWGRVAAHDVSARIVLRGNTAFALHPTRIERLGKDGWTNLDPARSFERPRDVWVAPSGELWVTDESEVGLFRSKGTGWEAVPSPVTAPRAVVGRSENALFVVGANGAAQLDGAHFRCVSGVRGPLHLAMLEGDTVWLGGASGAYRSAP